MTTRDILREQMTRAKRGLVGGLVVAGVPAVALVLFGNRPPLPVVCVVVLAAGAIWLIGVLVFISKGVKCPQCSNPLGMLLTHRGSAFTVSRGNWGQGGTGARPQLVISAPRLH